MLKPRPIFCPNVILLHANGSGEFDINEAKAIIEKVSGQQKLITVYIQNAIIDLNEKQVVIENYDYAIYKETRESSGNIASEYLKSGSDFVYYIKADIENFRTAFIHFYDILSSDYPIVCISGAIAKHLKAGAIIVENGNANIIQELSKEVYLPETLFTTKQFLGKQVAFKEKRLILD